MSRLVIAHIPDDVADIVAAVLRRASGATVLPSVENALNALANAVRDATDVGHSHYVTVAYGGDGAPLRLPALDSATPAVRMLRDAVGGDVDVLQLTVVVEGRAAS